MWGCKIVTSPEMTLSVCIPWLPSQTEHRADNVSVVRVVRTLLKVMPCLRSLAQLGRVYTSWFAPHDRNGLPCLLIRVRAAGLSFTAKSGCCILPAVRVVVA